MDYNTKCEYERRISEAYNNGDTEELKRIKAELEGYNEEEPNVKELKLTLRM